MNRDWHFHISETVPELGRATLEHLSGPAVGLSGGATFEKLLPFWRGNKALQCMFFPLEERCVGLSQPGSNWMNVIRLLLDPNGLHEQALEWAIDAEALEDVARGTCAEGEDGVPVADQVWLGLGMDGSVAGLYPYSSALEDLESVALHTNSPVAPYARVTLGLGPLRRAREVCIVAIGEFKGRALRQALDGDRDIPLVRLIENRQATFFIDGACARAAGIEETP